ncbi:hypothetical protein Acr_07g0003360 [Actinidia rufa]|uniref:Uncharacterized protein n=1 Tax=Actinidia rufa TaxID=165716 RepID=A0A7J0EVX4_9ERIC|nr:hypothetical protein Acr_07g0003360 [Actinidia rufa]
MEEERDKETGKGSERWSAAIVNLSEMATNLESLQKLLVKKAVYVDEETFAKASLSSEPSPNYQAAARARSEKRQAEAAQKAAELRAQEITRELENTTKVFELHMEELRAKQDEISKRDKEIKLLEAIIQTLGEDIPVLQVGNTTTLVSVINPFVVILHSHVEDGKMTTMAMAVLKSYKREHGTHSDTQSAIVMEDEIYQPSASLTANHCCRGKAIAAADHPQASHRRPPPHANTPNNNTLILHPRLVTVPDSDRLSMEEKPSRANLKRPLPEDDDSNKPPAQKRVRFPKGKKLKPGDEKVDVWKHAENDQSAKNDARLAAKERAMRRNEIAAELFTEENRGMLSDISAAEVHYEDKETFVNDGIQMEPFNLEREREEGYFDEQGNYVEDRKKIKRRIADVLEPGETVLKALRRLKGTSNNKKEKMSAETKLLFDQLTEDAMKLLENGDYKGYERLARAKGEGTSMDAGWGKSNSTVTNDPVSNIMDLGGASSLNTAVGPSNLDVSTELLPSSGDDTFDMFAEDDENATANATSDGSNLVSGPNHDRVGQPSESGGLQNDYVYDESSGYHLSFSLSRI